MTTHFSTYVLLQDSAAAVALPPMRVGANTLPPGDLSGQATMANSNLPTPAYTLSITVGYIQRAPEAGPQARRDLSKSRLKRTFVLRELRPVLTDPVFGGTTPLLASLRRHIPPGRGC
jgi:hypothetical protein